ncbi:MAG: SH3 domain-containing protein [Oscillospiraceae bacterium]|jgi:hypothetical protein|nr:SH3 domain-containing protein [Oscillospiraceae bacterium]
MSTEYPTAHQYEPLRTPSGWSDEEKRLIVQLTDIFDDLYRRFGRLRFKDLGNALKTRMEDESGNLAEVMLSTEGLSAAVNNNRLAFTAAGLEIRNAAGVTVFRQDNDTGNLTVSGQLAATGGTIGGFTIGQDALYNGTGIVLSSLGTVRLGQLLIQDGDRTISNDYGPTIGSNSSLTLAADNQPAMIMGEGSVYVELPLHAQAGLFVNPNLTTTNAPNAYIDPSSGRLYRSLSGGSGGEGSGSGGSGGSGGGQTFAPLAASISLNSSNYMVGQTVIAYAGATGGIGAYRYTFALSQDYGAYTPLSSSGATCSFALIGTGSYRVRVLVEDANGNSDLAYSAVIMAGGVLQEPSVTVTANRSQITGSGSVTWTAHLAGMEGLQYSVTMSLLKNDVFYGETVTGQTLTRTLTEPGTYYCTVAVTDLGGGPGWGGYGGTVVVTGNTQLAYTTGSNVNMRSGPGTGYSIVTNITAQGSYVEVTGGKSGEWYPVYWQGYTGYIIDDYLQLI